MRDEVQHRRGHRDRGGRRRPGVREQRRGAQSHGDQPHVLGRRIGKQPFEIRRHRSLQHAVQRGQSADHEQHQPPPPRARAEQLQIDAHDAVDTEVDHRRAHQRRHRARRLGVRARQPGVQRHQAGLRAEPHDGQQEDGRAHAVGQVGQRGEPVRSARRRQHHQPDQDRHEPELSHHRIDQCRRTDLGTGVFGQHQHQRCDRHQLPRQQERRHRPGRGHQQHRRDEQRQHWRWGACSGGGRSRSA